MKLPNITPREYIAMTCFLIPLIWGAFSFLHTNDSKIEDLDKKFTEQIQSVKISVQTVSGQITSIKNDRKRDSEDGKNDRLEIQNKIQDTRSEIKEIRNILLNRLSPYGQRQLTQK